MSEPNGEKPLELPVISGDRQFSAVSIRDLVRNLIDTSVDQELSDIPFGKDEQGSSVASSQPDQQ